MMVELKEKGVEAYNTIVDKATDTWKEIKIVFGRRRG